jgi:hypothetical protein
VPAAAELPAMPSYGYRLMCEFYDPKELLAEAARAEAAGFDFITFNLLLAALEVARVPRFVVAVRAVRP